MSLAVTSLFTGAGGLDLGFEAAGFRITAAVELERAACETLRANRRWRLIENDIHNVCSGEIGSSDVLVGGPPCQPFSKSAYWARRWGNPLNDPRTSTLFEYLRVLRDTLPRVFLLENVVGFGAGGKGEGLKLVQTTLNAINRDKRTQYSLSYSVLNAADFGVPQLRERVFVVGARDGRTFRFPGPTHSPVSRATKRNPNLLAWVTSWDAIGEMGADKDKASLSVNGKWGELLPSVPEGWNYLWHTERGGGLPLFGWRRRYWTFLLKLAKDQPSWTIQSQPGGATGPFHWQNRRLSTWELCRLHTFPLDYVISGRRSSAQRQIGNAVPPLLAEVLALEIRRQLLDAPLRGGKPTLGIDKAPFTPPPEPVARVPRKYMILIGRHAPHPGTGKGPHAARPFEGLPESNERRGEPTYEASSQDEYNA